MPVRDRPEMITVGHAQELEAYNGKELGASEWIEITQEGVNRFAALTGDDHWIHVDVARAEKEMPDGRTIAHGLYILSLIPVLQRQIYRIETRGRGLNYGFDRVRFVSPVQTGSRVRLKQKLIDASPHKIGTRLEIEVTFEIEGQDRPAMVASNIILIENP